MPKIMFYREKCIGCNVCVEEAPKFWKISEEDGKSTLKDSVKKKNVYVLEIDYVDKEDNLKAAENCPVGIIKIVE